MKGTALGGWVRELDRILRGDATRPSALRRGQVEVPAGGLTVVIVVLSMTYGACMGCFALFKTGGPSWPQILASAVKVPLLFVLTLVVTFPSLYVFNALVGSRLRAEALLKLLIAAMGVNLAVLASFGPITAFFSLTTESYPFMVLLNVAFFAVSGVLGLAFLLQTLHRLTLPAPPPAALPADAKLEAAPASGPEGALEHVGGSVLGKNVKAVFTCWVVVFALVGAQMSWVLRPFIGSPTRPFAWLRDRESNFFEAVGRALTDLLN
jgi:hypothetical protein